MGTIVIFEATILVYWAVVWVPYALREEKKFYIVLSLIPLFMIDLGLRDNANPFVKNLLSTVIMLCIAYCGGLIQHYFNGKKES